MGNYKSTAINTNINEIETDSINEEIDWISSTDCVLFKIIQSGNISIFEEWREKLPHIIRTTDPKGNNILHLSAYLNRSCMIRHLSQYVDANAANLFGETPLHIAATKGYKECIEALLGNGANVNVKNSCGNTPLHAVTLLGRNDCVEILLGYGADVNVHNCRNLKKLATKMQSNDFIVQTNNFKLKILDDNCPSTIADINVLEDAVLEDDNEENITELTTIHDNLNDQQYPANSVNTVSSNGFMNASESKLFSPFFNEDNKESDQIFQRGNCFRGAARKIAIGHKLIAREEKVQLHNFDDPDGDSPLQCAINSKNLAVFNLMIDHVSMLKITDDASFQLVEKAMAMNVPGVLRCLISNPSEDNREEFTADYLDQRLNYCIGKQGKNICVDYTPLISSNFKSMEMLLLIFLGISKDNNFECLLQHATIRTFLQWRWNQMATYFYINLYFLILVCLNIIIYKSQFYCTNDDLNAKGYISYNLILVNLIPVVLREIFQIRIDWRLYLLNSENYFEVSLIIYSIILLVWYPHDIATRIQVSAVGNILIAVSMTLQIGQHPWAASAVHLLKVVAYKFLRHFIVYIGILIGFAYSFHELRSIEKLERNLSLPSNDTSNETDSLNWLEFAGFTILRTAGMFIGELNLADFNADKSNYVLITILFLFIMFVSIMMLNLLNGLAVSNIFEKEELRISHFKTRIQYLYTLNSKINLFNDILSRLPKYLQTVLNRILAKLCKNNINNISNILILPTYISRKDLKINSDQQYIHNNKIHKDAYERVQKNKIRLNL